MAAATAFTYCWMCQWPWRLFELNWTGQQQLDPWSSTQLRDAFIGHARRRRDLIGCSETRPAGAQSVRVLWTNAESLVERASDDVPITIGLLYTDSLLPSVLWCCWSGGRKGTRPVKNWVMWCWRGYLSGARCRLAYGSADATATQFLLIQ